jgi:hypothetical protein
MWDSELVGNASQMLTGLGLIARAGDAGICGLRCESRLERETWNSGRRECR